MSRRSTPKLRAPDVDEPYKIRILKIVEEFRSSEKEKLEFPSNLDNQERKYIHELCLKLGLESKSTGKGEDRYITIRKPVVSQTLDYHPPLLLSSICKTKIEEYFTANPILSAKAIAGNRLGCVQIILASESVSSKY